MNVLVHRPKGAEVKEGGMGTTRASCSMSLANGKSTSQSQGRAERTRLTARGFYSDDHSNPLHSGPSAFESLSRYHDNTA